ncbi:MAG TPA: hypothetical protein PKW33_15455 [Anaerolineaceae bacterium]|nr:hypothetical protein [Anaerolineaceae bacterium]HPN52991.1 hypothetical protein [Anaerolineaceae bacterium]
MGTTKLKQAITNFYDEVVGDPSFYLSPFWLLTVTVLIKIGFIPESCSLFVLFLDMLFGYELCKRFVELFHTLEKTASGPVKKALFSLSGIILDAFVHMLKELALSCSPGTFIGASVWGIMGLAICFSTNPTAILLDKLRPVDFIAIIIGWSLVIWVTVTISRLFIDGDEESLYGRP